MKKRIVIVALLVCILVLSIASTTIAYFTDTEKATNTFTVGDVDIKLTEVAPDGTTVEVTDDENGESALALTYTNVYPTQKINKTPTITNVATDPAYVGAVVTIALSDDSDINTLFAEATLVADVKAFLSEGAINATSGYKVTVLQEGEAIKVYIIAEQAIAKDIPVALFSNVVIPADWDNDDMAVFAKLSITVDAYATQVAGMADLAEAANRTDVAAFAMESAFPEVFD